MQLLVILYICMYLVLGEGAGIVKDLMSGEQDEALAVNVKIAQGL